MIAAYEEALEQAAVAEAEAEDVAFVEMAE